MVETSKRRDLSEYPTWTSLEDRARRLPGLGVAVEKYTPPEAIGFSYDAVREGRERRVLQDQVIVVVGASYHGIGGATAREAALQGATVVTVSTPKDNTSLEEQLLEEIRDLGSRDSFRIAADITKEEDRKRILEETARFGRIDGIVITPAKLNDNFFIRMNEQNYRESFDINYFGPALLIKDAADHMLRRNRPRGGKIVVVSSLAAVMAPGQAEYGPAKAALDNLVESLPEEKLYRNTFFNAVSPGVVDTPMVSHIDRENRKALYELTHAERDLLPAEVAELAVYLLSPLSGANGRIVPIVGRGEMPSLDNRKIIPR